MSSHTQLVFILGTPGFCQKSLGIALVPAPQRPAKPGSSEGERPMDIFLFELQSLEHDAQGTLAGQVYTALQSKAPS